MIASFTPAHVLTEEETRRQTSIGATHKFGTSNLPPKSIAAKATKNGKEVSLDSTGQIKERP
jgi:hypothetical protein